MHYDPEFFQPIDLEHAKTIILSASDPAARDHRWAEETPFLCDVIRRELALNQRSLVLDFGCGIGRIAGALIDAVGCSVVGVDISVGMLSLAIGELASEQFSPCPRY